MIEIMRITIVSLLVTLAFSSPAFAILRPRFPIKPHAPYRGQVAIIDDDSLKSPPKNSPFQASR